MIKSPVVSYRADTDAASAQDEATIKLLGELNEGYGRAYLNSDVAWYDQMLADDFQCITSGGVRLNKQEFLKAAAEPVAAEDFRFEEVDIRLFGDVAIIHALNPQRYEGGAAMTTRYTDIWAKRDGVWRTISAQITRIASPS
jgi:ketosteroid isomerase-like protein